MSKFTVAALLAVLAVPASAQVTLGLGGGTGIGVRGGKASGTHEAGFVEASLPFLPRVRGEMINANTTGAGTVSLVASVVLEAPVPMIRPYVIAGLGNYGIDGKGAHGGWSVGAGLRTAFLVGPGIFVEARRHDGIARDLLTFGLRL